MIAPKHTELMVDYNGYIDCNSCLALSCCCSPSGTRGLYGFNGLCAQSTIGDKSSENGSVREIPDGLAPHQVGHVLLFCAFL